MNWDKMQENGYLANKTRPKFNNFTRILQFKRQNLRRPTRSERRFKKIYTALKGCDFKIEHQRIFLETISRTNQKAYIVDFYIDKLKLAFEIDGPSHKNRKQYDSIRDSFLNKRGIKVVRITNEQTLESEWLKETIKDQIDKRRQELKNNYKIRKFAKVNSYKPKPIKTKEERQKELEMQEQFIKKHGITKVSTIGKNRKATR